MRPTRAFLVAALLLAATTGCQDPDVGARCVLSWNSESELDPPTPQNVPSDYLETGNPACEDLICIVSPGEPGTRYGDCAGENGEACGYCSKPCVSHDDCFSSETGLYCESILLDEAFIASLPPEVAQRYVGDVRASKYCVVPNR